MSFVLASFVQANFKAEHLEYDPVGGNSFDHPFRKETRTIWSRHIKTKKPYVPSGAWHSFSIKNVFYDTMDLRLFHFDEAIYGKWHFNLLNLFRGPLNLESSSFCHNSN